MKLLLIHNRYQQPGGEDAVFDFEASLLEGAGHEVYRLVASNDAITTVYQKIRTAWHLPWNTCGYRLVAEAIAANRPDIMHVHNTFPLLSSSTYEAAAAAKVPVVQTLHNFRVTCANGLLLRDAAPCELCIANTPFNAVLYRCYRNSYLSSFAVARMIASQRRHRENLTKVARFVALSEFARSRFVLSGMPADKITVKPNGATDSTFRNDGMGNAILFVGRLSAEKGVETLIKAARFISYPVRIVGDGPLRDELEATAPPNVTFLGRLSRNMVIDEMVRARCLVLPSVWYEVFPLVVVEAYSVGLPVIASRLGSLVELVEDGVTGLHFAPNDALGLVGAIEQLTSDAAFAARMGRASRRRYEERFSPECVLRDLEAIYHSVMDKRRCGPTGRGAITV